LPISGSQQASRRGSLTSTKQQLFLTNNNTNTGWSDSEHSQGLQHPDTLLPADPKEKVIQRGGTEVEIDDSTTISPPKEAI
jgi:hypothetical protein